MANNIWRFHQEQAAGSPYWRLGDSGSPTWLSRKDVNTAITLPAEKEITDSLITVSADGIRMTPAVTGTVTTANQWRKSPMLNAWAVTNSYPDIELNYILKWNVLTASEPLANGTPLFTAVAAHYDGAGNTSNFNFGVQIFKTSFSTNDTYTCTWFRQYGDDNDNGGGQSFDNGSTIAQTFDRSVVGLNDGDFLRLRLRKRVSGTTSYFRWWLYKIGPTLPALEADHFTAGTMIARHAGDDTTEITYGPSAQMGGARHFGFQNTTGQDITVHSLKVENYTVASQSVDAAFVAVQDVAKGTDAVWQYLGLDLARGGNTNSFTTTFPVLPTGVTAEVVSDYGTGSDLLIRYKVSSAATVADGQTFTIRSTDGSVNVDISPTFNIKPAPGGSGSQTYLTGDEGDALFYGSSSIDLAKTPIASARTTRFSGWTLPTLVGGTTGMFGASGTNVTGSWVEGSTNAILANVLNYAWRTGTRRAIGIIPASNDYAQLPSAVRTAAMTFVQYLNKAGLDVIGNEVGFRAGTPIAVGSSTSGGVGSTTIAVDLLAGGNTFSGSSGTYTSAHYAGFEHTSGAVEVKRVTSYAVASNVGTVTLATPLVNTGSGVKNVYIFSATIPDNIQAFNAIFANMGTVGHADNYIDPVFGTTYTHNVGYWEDSLLNLSSSDWIHQTGTGGTLLANQLVQDESEYLLNRATITLSPTSATVSTGGTQDFNDSVTGYAALGASLYPTPLIGRGWSVASGGGTVDSNGLYTAPGSAGSATVRSTFTLLPTKFGSATVTIGSSLAAGTITENGVTSTTASLTATEATGGTGPYTKQWYRSTSSGFTPGAGNILAGQTSLTLNDSSLTPSTTYYYKIVYTDAASATATSVQEPVTTSAAAALVAGSLSLNGMTATSANLSTSAPTGGTAPYTYQWHRSTVTGFTPSGGTAIAGATSTTRNDTGLTTGTAYYYKVVYTDAASATATSSQIAVTPQAASGNRVGQGIIKRRIIFGRKKSN